MQKLVKKPRSYAGPLSTPDYDAEGDSERIYSAQTALVGLGYQIGETTRPTARIDGVGGPDTDAAIKQFQQEMSLEVSGHLDRETYAALLGAHEDAVSAQSSELTQDDESDPTEVDMFLR
jgi:peptidoglycan hydrolase-like protein with peptidoglycan-binding domain